jgi:hypothetical protein
MLAAPARLRATWCLLLLTTVTWSSVPSAGALKSVVCRIKPGNSDEQMLPLFTVACVACSIDHPQSEKPRPQPLFAHSIKSRQKGLWATQQVRQRTRPLVSDGVRLPPTFHPKFSLPSRRCTAAPCHRPTIHPFTPVKERFPSSSNLPLSTNYENNRFRD